jgi:hypothetical protein
MTRKSRIDQQLVNELKNGREELLSGMSLQALLSALSRRLPSVTRNIYIVDWIPEQGEDLYDVLVDGVAVVHLEIPRGRQDTEDMFEMWPVREYIKRRKGMTKTDRRKLHLAIQLAAAEIKISERG